MNPAAPPVPSGAHAEDGGTGGRTNVGVAVKSGLVACVATFAVAQIPPLLIELSGGGLSFSTARKLGWFYGLAFHRVGIDLSGAGGFEGHVSVAFLSGTAFAVWLLFRAGGRAAATACTSLGARLMLGVVVGLAYAVPIATVTSVVQLQLSAGGTILPDVVRFQGVLWQSFAFPAALGIVAGGAGATLAGRHEAGRSTVWLIGGWRMLLAALGLAAIGILMLAAVRPEGLATYTRAASANGSRPAMLLLGHHALLLPNQSFFVLAPSMGGCTSLTGPGGTAPLVCAGALPADDAALLEAIARDESGAARTPAPTRPMPAGYWLFVLVPAIATVGAGRWAGRTWRGPSARERLFRGAGAGVVFAALVGAGTWMATLDVGVTLSTAGTPSSFTLGAGPRGTAALALLWGLAGGSLGAWLAGAQDEGTPVPVEPDAPVPPSPTSV